MKTARMRNNDMCVRHFVAGMQYAAKVAKHTRDAAYDVGAYIPSQFVDKAIRSIGAESRKILRSKNIQETEENI